LKDDKTKQQVKKLNREIRQEDLRERIKGTNLLAAIIKTELDFARVFRDAKDKKGLSAPEKNRMDIMLKALAGRQANQFKRLDKILPDLKAIELSDPDGNPIVPTVQIITNGQAFNPFPPIDGEPIDVEFSTPSKTTDRPSK
jgi:hypothetical protein